MPWVWAGAGEGRSWSRPSPTLNVALRFGSHVLTFTLPLAREPWAAQQELPKIVQKAPGECGATHVDLSCLTRGQRMSGTISGHLRGKAQRGEEEL